MQISDIDIRGKVFQSQLLLKKSGIEHFSSMKETQRADEGIWLPKQVHGVHIHLLESGETVPPTLSVEADAVLCNIPGQWIGIRTADCVPILLYDAQHQVVAAIHAGWRGTVKHIVQEAIRRMQSDFGSQASDLWAMIGPSISPTAYEVGPEVAEEFKAAGRAACIVGGYTRPHLDLRQCNVMDLLEEGVELDKIDCSPLCTFEQELLFSARREGIETGRNVTAIRLKG
ncbi:MAG: peptidoglycan editing factor PgeF [Bacteroidales bacterium]|nr:peptidoglycan editing factor PgeF [Bacteroidales bacterium]